MLRKLRRKKALPKKPICFNYAKENNFDILITLDGDGQHGPSHIPDFINALKTNKADVVIGSRNRKCGMQIKVQSL